MPLLCWCNLRGLCVCNEISLQRHGREAWPWRPGIREVLCFPCICPGGLCYTGDAHSSPYLCSAGAVPGGAGATDRCPLLLGMAHKVCPCGPLRLSPACPGLQALQLQAGGFPIVTIAVHPLWACTDHGSDSDCPDPFCAQLILSVSCVAEISQRLFHLQSSVSRCYYRLYFSLHLFGHFSGFSDNGSKHMGTRCLRSRVVFLDQKNKQQMNTPLIADKSCKIANRCPTWFCEWRTGSEHQAPPPRPSLEPQLTCLSSCRDAPKEKAQVRGKSQTGWFQF